MTHAIRTGTTDQIAFFRAYDTDGTAKVNLTSATTGLTLSVFRVGASAVSISSLSDKAADNTAHADGAIRQVQGNLYTVDLPDAAVASQCPSICVKGTYTGGVIEGVPHPIVGYDGTAARVGASDGTGVTLAADQAVNVTKWDGTAVGSVTINCNMTQISGDSGAADNAESFFDGTGYAGTNNVIPTVSTVTSGVTVTTNNDKTGYSLTQSFPTNFSSLAITAGGAVTVGTVNDKTGYSLSQSFPTHFADMQIAANGHVSAVVESMANNSITASAIQGDAITAAKIAADAVTEIQSGLATQSSLNTLIQYVDTEVAAIKAVTDKVDTMVEVDGLVYRYTTNALEQAPAGGGGGGTDWTADERTAIRTILGIPGSGTTPADPSDGVLYDIKQKTDQIGSAGAITNLLAGAVLDPGTITSFPSELVIGDSYQETDGREIQIPLVDTDGNVLTTIGSRNLADATATFEIRRINESDSTRVITGVATIVDPPGTGTTTALGAPYAIIELPASETLKGLPSYRYYGKITLEWAGPGTDIMSFKTDVIKFTY